MKTRDTRVQLMLLAALAAVVLFVVYHCDPARVGWMPRCIFHSLTGLDCPSCGSTRAVHALLHGHFVAGLRYNPFVIVSWPVMAVVLAYALLRPRAVRPRWFWWMIYAYIVLFMLWWVVRNVWDL